ncbi:MAG: DUF1849 family protein [Alphaproteobacteria bacterium]|nr:DUF1849 family protein [Alphaproteobacteria bacterium]
MSPQTFAARPCAAVLALLLATDVAAAATLLPHRAIYDMRLASPRGQSGVEDVSGRLTVEWADVCDGWTVDQRLALVVDFGEEMGPLRTYSTFVSWESKDGLAFRFEDRTWHSDGGRERLGGMARLPGPGASGEAHLTGSEETVIALPGSTMFPTHHSLELIDRARAGEIYVVRLLFDGSSTEEVSEVATAIGAEEPTPADAVPVPGADSGWPMRLAFFPGAGGDD